MQVELGHWVIEVWETWRSQHFGALSRHPWVPFTASGRLTLVSDVLWPPVVMGAALLSFPGSPKYLPGGLTARPHGQTLVINDLWEYYSHSVCFRPLRDSVSRPEPSTHGHSANAIEWTNAASCQPYPSSFLEFLSLGGLSLPRSKKHLPIFVLVYVLTYLWTLYI